MPRPRSSPWIRRYPHLGFSRASRRTRFLVSGSMAGLPGRRCGLVHFLATSCRCHRRSVSGRTMNERHVALGRSLLAAARNARSVLRYTGRFTCRRKWPLGAEGRRFPDPPQPPCARSIGTGRGDGAAQGRGAIESRRRIVPDDRPTALMRSDRVCLPHGPYVPHPGTWGGAIVVSEAKESLLPRRTQCGNELRDLVAVALGVDAGNAVSDRFSSGSSAQPNADMRRATAFRPHP